MLIKAYALAVSEQNGSASYDVVTAPTCGACGVLPGVLYYMYCNAVEKVEKSLNSRVPNEIMERINGEIINALAVASIFGNVSRANATISGAEGGC